MFIHLSLPVATGGCHCWPGRNAAIFSWRFWRVRRRYRFVVVEKLRYMHRNPLKRDWCRSRNNGPGAAIDTTPTEKEDWYW